MNLLIGGRNAPQDAIQIVICLLLEFVVEVGDVGARGVAVVARALDAIVLAVLSLTSAAVRCARHSLNGRRIART